MTIDNMEEVFAYFEKLSGAKRIEVLSGIVHRCIPLELRFLASLVESLARKDYVTLLEDEHKANSPHELQQLCSNDLLADVSPLIRFPSVMSMVPPQPRPPASMSPNHVSSSGQSDNGSDDGRIKITISGAQRSQTGANSGTNDQISPPPMSQIPDVVNIANYTQTRFNPGVHAVHQQHVNMVHSAAPVAPPVPADCLLSNVRKKIVVYLCLLSSTNRVAASVLYDAFRKFLSADNLKRHLELCSINMAGLSIGNDDPNQMLHQDPNQIVVQGPSAPPAQMVPTVHVPILDHQLVAELTLIHTMAIYHPAFVYEQQSFLCHELEKLTELFNNLNPARVFSQSHQPNQNMFVHNHHRHSLCVAELMNQEPTRSPPICCYNCGRKGHLGHECTEETLDEATRDTNFQMNFRNPAPPITVPTIMTTGQVIQVSTTLPQPQLQQSLTPPVPLSPAISNKVTDLQNGPQSITGKKNTLNNIGLSSPSSTESSNHQPLRTGDGSNYSSPASSSVNASVAGTGGGSGSKRAPHALYVAPHMRNRGDRVDRESESSPGSDREPPARVVRIHNAHMRNDHGHHRHHH